jgi:signal transduction histidine kinase
MLAAAGRAFHSGQAWLIGAYLIGYVALDWLSYVYPVVPPLAITPWNPPPGLSLALLLRSGLWAAPWLFVASLLAEVFVRGAHVEVPALLAASMLPAAAYTALAALLRTRLRFQADFATLRDATLFVAAVTVMVALTAVAVATLLRWTGYLPAASYYRGVAQFWLGDLLGIVVTTPLLLVLTRKRALRPRARLSEIVVQLGAVMMALWVVFGSGWFDELKLFYVLFLPLIWIAMRWGIEGTAITIAIIQVGLIVALRLGGYGADTVVEFQVLLLALAVTALFLGLTVSERRAVERQLRDKQLELDRSLRLASASEMATALAHELNQPLTAIGTYARACQTLVQAPGAAVETLRETMDKVVHEVTRAGDIVRQIRDFFRTGSGQLARIAVAPLLESALEAARQGAEGHQVDWRLQCQEPLPDVLVDRIQIETVLHNLLSNAIDALKGVPAANRRVTITASRDRGEFVRIQVMDSGPGLSPEMNSQLFRPFTTSKPHGMGLGLAISRSIVEAHGGRLWLESSQPGCTFAFTLPVATSTL